jgi:hypothetical protein
MGNLATAESTAEGGKMLIDDTLYQEFRQRYGTIAADLIIFYTQLGLYGDKFLRMWYPERTYYRYRHTLVRDGYLSIDQFRSKGGGVAYWP